MKKFHVLRILLIAVLTVTALPMPAANEQQAQTKTFRQKATKRFNESVTRFKRCLNRECTKGELVKVGKELIAAIGTLIVVGGIGYVATTRKKQKPLATIPSQFKVGDIVAVGTPPFDPDQEIDVFVISDVDPQTGRLLVSRYKDNQALPLSVETNEIVLPISDITKIKQGTYSFGVGSRYFITYEDLAPQATPTAKNVTQPQFHRKDIVALIDERRPSNELYLYVVDETDPLKVIPYEDRMSFDAIGLPVKPEQLIPVTDTSKIKKQNLYGDISYYIEHEG